MRLILAMLFFTVLVAGVWAVSLLMEPEEGGEAAPQPAEASSSAGESSS